MCHSSQVVSKHVNSEGYDLWWKGNFMISSDKVKNNERKKLLW